MPVCVRLASQFVYLTNNVKERISEPSLPGDRLEGRWRREAARRDVGGEVRDGEGVAECVPTAHVSAHVSGADVGPIAGGRRLLAFAGRR